MSSVDPHYPDAALYPDLREGGGLAEVISHILEEEGLELGEISSPRGRGCLTEANIETSNGRFNLLLGADERRFSIKLIKDNYPWMYGGTSDIRQMVYMMSFWQSGSSLRELTESYPFMKFDEMGAARENGTLSSFLWKQLVQSSEGESWFEFAQLASLAPRLSELFPYSSYGTLRISSNESMVGSDILHIKREVNGQYQVLSPEFNRANQLTYRILGEVGSARDAVRVAVEFLT